MNLFCCVGLRLNLKQKIISLKLTEAPCTIYTVSSVQAPVHNKCLQKRRHRTCCLHFERSLQPARECGVCLLDRQSDDSVSSRPGHPGWSAYSPATPSTSFIPYVDATCQYCALWLLQPQEKWPLVFFGQLWIIFYLKRLLSVARIKYFTVLICTSGPELWWASAAF